MARDADLAQDDLLAPKLEGLSTREVAVYWGAKYEEAQTHLWNLQRDAYTRGSIGAGSTIYQGFDPEVLGLGVGIAGVTLGIAGFVVITAAVGAIGLAIGFGGVTVGLLGFWRRNKRLLHWHGQNGGATP